MLTSVDVQSENPFVLEIRDAKPTDSIIVEKIEGLGPPDVDLFMGDYARDGGSYSGRRVPPRNVTFTLRINPNYKENESVSGLRDMLYKAFMDPFTDADSLPFILHDDELPDRFIEAHTEKFDTDIFSGETLATIAMRCPNPYILDVEWTSLAASGSSLPFQYDGNAGAGIQLEVEFTTSSSITTIELNGKKLFLNYPFLTDDVLFIDTRRGYRKIQVTRGSETTDILYALDPDSVWLELHSLANLIKLYGEVTTDIPGNFTDVTFRTAYWGI
jgi:phage-related protein